MEYREQFDFVVSRATAYFPVLLEYAIPLLKVG
jgi:16S rRNA G527 N7-methylase RsmG